MLLALVTLVNQVGARLIGAHARPSARGRGSGRRRWPSTSASSASSSTTAFFVAGRDPRARRASTSARRCRCSRSPLPVGDLVLHLPGDLLRRRRPPPARRAGPHARRRDLPLASSRTSWPARSSARGSSCRSSPRRATRTTSPSAPADLAHRARARQEGGDRRLPRALASSTPSSPSRTPTAAPDVAARRLRLRRADLLRLLGLHRHRDRPGPAHGLRLPAELRPPVPLGQPFGEFWRRWHMTLSRFLRDFLYIPLGRQPRRAPVRRPQPHDHDGPRRAVARRGVDVRAVGRLPRRLPRRRAPVRAAACALPALAGLAHHLPPRRVRAGSSSARPSLAASGRSSPGSPSPARRRCGRGRWSPSSSG